MNYGFRAFSMPAPVDPVVSLVTGAWENLRVRTRALPSADTRIQIQCDRILLVDDGGNAILVRDAHLGEQPDYTYPDFITINGSAPGANGLDVGALVDLTWYYIWVISTSDGAKVRGVLSLSSTRPVLPPGFTHYNRVGAAYYQSLVFRSFIQRDNRVLINTTVVMVNQAPYAGQNNTMVPVSDNPTNGALLRSCVPPPPVSRTVQARAMTTSAAATCLIRVGGLRFAVGVQVFGGSRVQQNFSTSWGSFNAGQDLDLPMFVHDIYWGTDATGATNGLAIMGWTL